MAGPRLNPPSLDALRDIHLPPSPALWPALEWWLAAGILVALGVVWFALRLRRRRRLRAALRDLSRLATAHAQDGDTVALARGLSRLVRGYAVMRFPQARIAGLTGSAWLQFLDAHGGAGAFCNGIGAMLETLPYQARGDLDAASLMALVRRWLEANPQ